MTTLNPLEPEPLKYVVQSILMATPIVIAYQFLPLGESSGYFSLGTSIGTGFALVSIILVVFLKLTLPEEAEE